MTSPGRTVKIRLLGGKGLEVGERIA